MPTRSGRRSTWTSEEDRLLGTAPDADVAIRLSRSSASVETRRARLGIPPYDRRSTGGAEPIDPRSLVGRSRYERRLSGMSVSAIAAADGVTISSASKSIRRYAARAGRPIPDDWIESDHQPTRTP